MKNLFTAFSLSLLSCCLMAGCAETKPADKASAHGHDHDHDDHEGHDHDDHEGHDHDGHEGHDHDDHEGHDHDDHADVHGPFGGHVFSFDNDDYRGEWKHYNDNDVIRIYILDASGKKEAAVNGTVTLTPLAGAEKTPFELDGEDANEKGETAVYSLDDKDLTIAVTAAGVKVDLTVGDKKYEGVIEAHEPHDH